MKKFNLRAQSSLAIMIAVTLIITLTSFVVARVAYNQYVRQDLSRDDAQSFLLADSGAEVALLELCRDADYPGGTIAFPEGSVTIGLADTMDGKTLTTSTTVNDVRRDINIDLEITQTETITGHYLEDITIFAGDGIEVQGQDALLTGDIFTNDGVLIQNSGTVEGNIFASSGTTQLYNSVQVIDNPLTPSITEGNVESMQNANIYNNVYIQGSVTSATQINTNGSVTVDGGTFIDPSLEVDPLAVPTFDFDVLKTIAQSEGTLFNWAWEMDNYIELNDVQNISGTDTYVIEGVYYLDTNDTVDMDGNRPYQVTGTFASEDGNVEIGPRRDYVHVDRDNYPLLAAGDSVYVRNLRNSAKAEFTGVIWADEDVELEHVSYNGGDHGVVVTGSAWAGDDVRIRNHARLIIDTTITSQVQGFDFSVPPTGATWYDENWEHRMLMTLDHTMVQGSSSLNAFQYAIDLTIPDLIGETQADADDILFTAANGTTKLSHEIEAFDSSTGELTAWVLLPVLSASADTEIYMYYGNAAASAQENPDSVWPSSTFGFVHHMEEGSNGDFDILDSSASGSDSTQVTIDGAGSNVNANGKVGPAMQFDGNDDQIYLADRSQQDPGSEFTIQAWVRIDSFGPGDSSFVSKAHNVYPYSSYGLAYNTSEEFYFEMYNSGGSFHSAGYWGTVNTGTWYLVSGIKEADDTLRIYVNGNDTSNWEDNFNGSELNGNAPFYIGSWDYDVDYHDGRVDEARMVRVARSREWIKTEFRNQNNASNYITLGAQEDIATTIDDTFDIISWEVR